MNWDNYKASFEQQASRILGHPVHVTGDAEASILPSPSLTFTNVVVGADPARPMMKVARFAVTVELMPLLEGKVHVVSMTLERPEVRVTANATGALDWLKRPATAEVIQPDRFSLADVEIRDGALTYDDPSAGIALSFDHVTATVDTPSLAGPWHVDGSYRDNGTAVPFRIVTGRRLAEGTIRVKVDFSPAGLPVSVSADGVVGATPNAGLTYTGTYGVTEVVDATASAEQQSDTGDAAQQPPPPGWSSQGSYTLSRDGLEIDKAVLSNGPPDRPTSFAGSLTVGFGAAPSFDAVVESRQLDIDRSFGGGPNAPVDVSEKAKELVAWLAALPRPPIPGHLRFSVPAVVAGGAVIQNLGFEASPAANGWQVKDFHAELPGQAVVNADGLLKTTKGVGFSGKTELSVVQPATFAAWWRGGGSRGGQLLPAFDIGGKVDIARDHVQVSNVNARIGDSTVTGSFAWGAAGADGKRQLGATLKADRIDIGQVKALADLLLGQQLTDVRSLADSFAVDLTADVFRYRDVMLKGIRINARYADDVLNVVQFGIDDIAGASFKITSGRIEGLTSAKPRGRLDAHFEAQDFSGLASMAARLAPDSGLVAWLSRTAPSLAPTVLDAHVTAPPTPGGSGLSISLTGVAGQTTVKASARTSKEIASWRSAETTFDAYLESPDSAALASQFGFTATAPQNDSGGTVRIHGSGIPDDGLDTTVDAEFAGLTATAKGKLAIGIAKPPTFDGAFAFTADNLDPLIAAAGLSIPGAATGTKLDLAGTLGVADGKASFAWKNGTVGTRAVSGTFSLARAPDQTWQVGGDLDVDAVDLGWLTSLGLGFSPLPTGKPDEPWSKAPFGPPTYGPVSGKLTVATQHFYVGDTIDIANGKLTVDLQPQRIAATLTGGQLAGGTAGGTVTIANVDGNANLNASVDLSGAALQSFVWQRDGRAVATGTFDLKGSFEATGRTPAGLVSSATGGGVLTIRDGEARYVNPNTARLIVRASDLGQEYSDTELAKAVADAIDADSLKFGETGTAFSMAAGAVRIKDMTVRSPDLGATGDTVIDFNALTIDSDWTLKFNPGDDKVQGTDPKVGLIFSGPLAAPTRKIDPLPLSSYLNTRRAARMLEIIATEEADRAERARLARLVVKLKQDRDRAARIAAAAAAAEHLRAEIAAAAAQKIFDAHVAREAAAEQRAAEALQHAVERAVAAQAAAEKAAAAAADRATAARAKAAAAEDALAAAVAADKKAQAALADAAQALAAAQKTSDAAKAIAAADLATADAAETTALDARSAETTARDTLAKAIAELKAADKALQDATAKAAAAGAAADEATRQAQATHDALMAADSELTAARNTAATTAAASAAAETALRGTTNAAKQAAEAAAKAAAAATTAANERDARKADAASAASDAATAATALDAARTALSAAEQDSTRLADALDVAKQRAADAQALADSQPPGGDTSGQNSAQATAQAAQLALSAAQARADRARQILDVARGNYTDAAAAAKDAEKAAAAAQAALDDATATADAAEGEAKRTAAANDAAQARLKAAKEARDAAVRRADAAATAAQQAAAAFDQARPRARDAEDRATEATRTANAAAIERAAAARRVAIATSAQTADAFALRAAIDATDVAIAKALATRKIADQSNAEAVAAASSLASVRANNETATAAADAAAKARADAEAKAAAAEAAAKDAEAAAAQAAAEAKARAGEADAAKRRAGLAMTLDQPAPVVPPANPPPKTTKPTRTSGGDQPLVITPPYR